MEKMKLHTPNLADENFARLAALFPNAITETTDADDKVIRAIDKDVLMQEINCYVVDGKEERYQFTWPDKKKSVLLANAPSTNTLRPCAEESVGRGGEAGGFDSENLYIEGDNLEVLKLLKETYLHKIKMIYIDPPYNTGNDFVYDDDFKVESEKWKVESGDFDGSGNRLVKNLDSNGRFHTDWLNMIYPRLRLAKDLLTDDGVIFISIDEHESHNLRKICDEIFGINNFITNIVWEKRYTRSNNSKRFTTLTEPVLCYCKNSACLESIKEKRNEKADSTYSNPDNDPRGVWTSVSYVNPATKEQRPNLVYPLINPFSNKEVWHPTNAWKYEKSTYEEHMSDNKLYWGKTGENTYPRLKKFLSEMEGGMVPVDLWKYEDSGSTDLASKELETLFGRKIFDFPKPKELIIRMLSLILNEKNDDDFIILDFFSGSATTAHAVMQLNAEDGGNRKFIMVQLPEKCDESSEAFKAGYKNICEIGKERIRRAGKLIIENEKLKDKSSSQNDLFSKDNSQLSTVNSQLDVGFRVLKLDTSNMQEVYYTPQATDQQMLSGMVDNIKPDRTDMDLLFQVILEYGLPLSMGYVSEVINGCKVHFYGLSREQVDELKTKKLSIVNSQFSIFLAACFDKAVNDAVVTEIAKAKPQYVALRDMDSDATLTNFEQIFNAISPETVCKVV